MHCSNCGAAIESGQPKCPACGLIQDSFVYKSRIAAAALAIFAGIFGGHRFYLGQWWGVFYILFFWTYIPLIVGFIEGIVFLCTSQKSWNEKYNQGISAGSEKGVVVIVLACLFLLILAISIIGILAAVAIPAYQDYTKRAHIVEGMALAAEAKTAVSEYYGAQATWPTSNTQAGIANKNAITGHAVTSVEITATDGQIRITYNDKVGAADKNVLVLKPEEKQGSIKWGCSTGTTVPSKLLPANCRKTIR